MSLFLEVLLISLYIICVGDSEVQRTMLELLNQLDGFEPKQNIKVKIMNLLELATYMSLSLS